MSNPVGKDTINISVNVPLDLYEQINSLAAQNNMKMGGYVRLVLNHARKEKMQFEIIEPRVIRENPALNEVAVSYSDSKSRQASVAAARAAKRVSKI